MPEEGTEGSTFQDEPTPKEPEAAKEVKTKKKNRWRLGRKKKNKSSKKQTPEHMYKIEGMEDAMAKEAAKKERRRKRRMKRYELIGKITVALCCCGCIAAIVIVSLVIAEVGKWADEEAAESSMMTVNPIDVTPSPTLPGGLRPTKAPVAPVTPTQPPVAPPTNPPTKYPTRKPTPSPTPAPTKSPMPTASVHDSYTLVPNQDTYINIDGFYENKSFGKEDTFLIQNGLRTKEEIPDSFAIMTFDTSDIPSFGRMAADGKKAVLRLTHKDLDIGDLDELPAQITVSRMYSTPLDIEALHGGSWPDPQFWDGPTVTVETTDKVVEFDISSLVFNDLFEDNQLFLKLENRGEEQQAGDRFYSRESDNPPQLILSDLKKV